VREPRWSINENKRDISEFDAFHDLPSPNVIVGGASFQTKKTWEGM